MITEQCECPGPCRRMKTPDQWLCMGCGKACDVTTGDDACHHKNTKVGPVTDFKKLATINVFDGPAGQKLTSDDWLEVSCGDCGQITGYRRVED